MVTAEFAVALPAFVLVVVAAVCGVATMTAQLRCTDAAGVAARLAARGESASIVRAAALAGAPSGAAVTVASTNDTVTATVRAAVSPIGALRFLPAVTVHASVVQAKEPDGAAPGAAGAGG
jgi:Flp pilus assembly protein TadG